MQYEVTVSGVEAVVYLDDSSSMGYFGGANLKSAHAAFDAFLPLLKGKSHAHS